MHFGGFLGVAWGHVCPEAVPSDVSDDEWAFVAPYLTLMAEAALHRIARRRRQRDP